MKKQRNLFGGSTNFKSSLTISVIVLVCLFAFILSQILKLQTSGNEIVTNLKETEKINKLLSNLILIEEKFDNNDLNIKYLDSIKTENTSILTELEKKKSELSNYINNQSEFYTVMEYNLFDRDSLNSTLAIPLAKRTKQIKKELLNWYSHEVEASTQKFDKDNSFFSQIFIISTIIGFIIIGLALLKIIEARATIYEKSSILDSILENTNDIANFYQPIYNDDDQIEDFKITYASRTNLSLTHLPYKELIGERATVAYPFLKTSMLYNQLVSAFENQQYFEKTIEAPIDGKLRYYKARYVPVKGGLQVMITELTSLYTKQQELEKINSELSLTNQLFHEAEEVAEFGSFVWYMQDDITLMSDNIYRILGFKPQEFNISASKFREFTHPDDIEMYDEALGGAYQDDQPIEITFRVITNDKKIKHVFAKCDFSERDGETIMVGVLQDVSNRIKNEITLKRKNAELLRRNAELDSFNRVASHDLQEPLRKIQMFISRINDSKDNSFDERSLKFFDKIENAATRMRSLINNLLAFSRIDNKDYKLEIVDLKDVFDHVLETFSEAAPDSDIELNREDLPTLFAIPFLMEQLFTNIIGNAIKYRSIERRNVIKIECTKISKKQITQEFDMEHKNYYQFKIIDNGIGFNQKESEKIFTLFHRLHSKSDYAGTGLGLAICEKIVSKHHGHIYAKGVKNEGAEFVILLPVSK